MTDLSIVIVSYNTSSLLRDCLASVERCRDELSHETFVVDNASRDDSCDMVAAEFPWVNLIRNDRNVGFAGANNQALERAQGRYLLLLNSDTVVEPGAFPEMVTFMDGHGQAGYCGPRLLNPDGSDQPSARRFPTVLSAAFSVIGLAHKRPDNRHTLDLHPTHGFDTMFQADWFCGACLLVRREAMDRVGLLDDGYFLYFEETDWCRRMQQAGWQGWFVPAARVVHYGGQSVGQTTSTAPFSGDHPSYWVRSRRRFMRKHYGLAGMLTVEALDVALHALIWIKHFWRSGTDSRRKARRASATIRHLLT